jgi:hypothetical protein
MRQGTRAVAIYLSDVLLWLSVASLLEFALVFVAGALCIMTAGFLFEGMKKNPVVLVLGAAVALGGTFLMFREVRALIWPPVLHDRSAGEGASTNGAPFATFRCVQLAESMCRLKTNCQWNVLVSRCTDRIESAPFSATVRPSPVVPLACAVATKQDCDGRPKCYWSVLTDSCQKLRVGSSLLSETKSTFSLDTLMKNRARPSCEGRLSQTGCLATGGCRWVAGTCFPDPAAKPSGQ